EMNNNIDIISIEGITMYMCKKCDEMSKRRYNMERHFTRFHETILPEKTCCTLQHILCNDLESSVQSPKVFGLSKPHITFATKSDFYKHKEKIHEQKYTKGRYQNFSKTKQDTHCITVFTKRDLYKRKKKNEKKKIHEKEEYAKGQNRKTSKIESSEVGTFFTTNNFYEEKKEEEENHNEKKKYTKGQNRKTSKTKSFEVEQRETLIDTQMEFSETQNNNKNLRLLYENLNAPKKQFLYKWQKNSSYQLHTKSRRAPLMNMENDTSRKTAMKRASRNKIKRLNFLNLDKENVKVYSITDHSNEGIYKGLNSIIF
ncbi:hypothetical protein ALC57_08318, partial [Trachymyrmex cornetzi]